MSGGLCRDVNWVGEHVITYQIYGRVCMDMSNGWDSVCGHVNRWESVYGHVTSPYVIRNRSSCGGPAKNWPVIFSIDYKLYYKLCDRGNKCFEALLQF